MISLNNLLSGAMELNNYFAINLAGLTMKLMQRSFIDGTRNSSILGD